MLWEAILEKVQRYWPISVLLSALTFLANIELVEEYAGHFSTLLQNWRAILHGLF